MRVELTEHPKGNQRFEILLGDVIHIIRLDQAKQLADWIYNLHPSAKTEHEKLKKAALFLTQSLTDSDLEAVKAQWGVNINTVWNARNKLIALLIGEEHEPQCPPLHRSIKQNRHSPLHQILWPRDIIR